MASCRNSSRVHSCSNKLENRLANTSDMSMALDDKLMSVISTSTRDFNLFNRIME